MQIMLRIYFNMKEFFNFTLERTSVMCLSEFIKTSVCNATFYVELISCKIRVLATMRIMFI